MTRDASVAYIPRISDTYDSLGYPSYKWVVHPDPPPFQPLKKPLSRCRLALAASGGIYVAGQKAFHHKDDTSYRAVPMDTKTKDLRATHFAYDLTAARKDPNAVFPIDTLRSLRAEGFIGRLARNAYTFMGGIYSARRVREELAPRITERLLKEEVDALLLVPV